MSAEFDGRVVKKTNRNLFRFMQRRKWTVRRETGQFPSTMCLALEYCRRFFAVGFAQEGCLLLRPHSRQETR